jgi:hypothetical protein
MYPIKALKGAFFIMADRLAFSAYRATGSSFAQSFC